MTRDDDYHALTSSSPHETNPHKNHTNHTHQNHMIFTTTSTHTSPRETFRQVLWEILENKKFQWFIIFMIVINAITMGLETFDFVTDNDVVLAQFAFVDNFFLVFFSIELVLQFILHGTSLFHDGWLTFDFIIISLSWMFQTLQVIRSLRILRVMRLISRLDTLKKLVSALFTSVPELFNIFLLLLLIFYTYAVMFTSMFKDLYRNGQTDLNYFSRLDFSFFTLFQFITMDCWSCVATQVMAVYPWAWLPIISFILISAFVVINLVIAVICDALSEYQRREIEEQLQQIMLTRTNSQNSRLQGVDVDETKNRSISQDTITKTDGITLVELKQMHSQLEEANRKITELTQVLEAFVGTKKYRNIDVDDTEKHHTSDMFEM